MISIRKDVQAAWILLKILGEEYRGTKFYYNKLSIEYGVELSYFTIRDIVGALSSNGLLVSHSGLGIKRSNKRIIYLTDIMQALGYEKEMPTGPVMKIYDTINAALDELFIVNKFLGEENVSNEI